MSPDSATERDPSRPGEIEPGQTSEAERAGSIPDPVTAPEDATRRDWVEADKSRPTLPEETDDGLDEMEEEIRHQAEDIPLDTPGRLL